MGSLPPPPAANHKVVEERAAAAMRDRGFYENLESYCLDQSFGLGLNSQATAEFIKVFKQEHRKMTKGLTIADIDDYLEKRRDAAPK